MKNLLVVVDMQNDFITGALANNEAVKIVPIVKQEILDLQKNNWDIVYTRDTHQDNYLSTQEGKLFPVPHCIKNTKGWEIESELYLGGKIFDKPVFGSIDLAQYIKDNNYKKVELIGVCTDICVISNAMLIKAFCPETKVLVKKSACAGVTVESHKNALNAMKACQIEII